MDDSPDQGGDHQDVFELTQGEVGDRDGDRQGQVRPTEGWRGIERGDADGDCPGAPRPEDRHEFQ